MKSVSHSSSISELLLKINEQSTKTSKLETSRLAHELRVIQQRLEKGDYQRFSYTKNTFDVPNRARDFFTELEFYCHLGETWAAILGQLDIADHTKVADLCPGYTPKVELGLFYSNFKGEVVVIDTDDDSVRQLQKFMALFRPQFKISKNILNLFTDTADSYDVVLGNHIIDDLILYYYSQKQGIPLAKLYAEENTMVTLWEDLLTHKDSSIKEITPLITKILSKLVAVNGYLCLSQYPSYMERMLGIADAPTFSKNILINISHALKEQGFVSEHEKIEQAFTDYKGHFTADDCILLRREF